MKSADPILQLEGLTVDFNPGKPTALRALDGVLLSIGEGEIVGLVGESGSGKTVLSHSILGLLPGNGRVTSGRIVWRGRELQTLPERQLRPIRGKEIAMIFQDPQVSLNPLYTIGQQILWNLEQHRGLAGAEARAETLDLLDSVKLKDPERCARSYPHELSGGMSQRALIGLALAGRPKLLIADEPTSALDVSVAAEIVSLLSDLRTRFDLSILIITHDLGVATRLADRIAVLDHSRLVEDLPVGEFIGGACHPASRKLVSTSRFMFEAMIA